jgi:hypothetical protein
MTCFKEAKVIWNDNGSGATGYWAQFYLDSGLANRLTGV